MKPMLAVDCKGEVQFPVYASPKLDGIRCLIVDGVAMSRSLKPIPNKFVQEWVAMHKDVLNGLDGELIVGSANDKNAMQNTSSGVMSQDGAPDFTFHVFDYWTHPYDGWSKRWQNLQVGAANFPKRAVLLKQVLITTQQELDNFESDVLSAGYEGVMLKAVNGLYKYGRSTLRQGYLLKLKRFSDGEAIIVGVQELMRNHNAAKVGELGQTVRSSEKAGLEPAGTMGALVVKDMVTAVEFSIGTGFDAEQRQHLWDNRASIIGKIVKYKHFETGVKTAPRFPVFQGFRDEIDL